jgi:DNA-directed RNA polymerase subunit RPC12/RpoP
MEKDDTIRENQTEKNTIKAEVECPRCTKKWLYGGSRKFYVQCPDCKYTFRRNKERPQSVKVVRGPNQTAAIVAPCNTTPL